MSPGGGQANSAEQELFDALVKDARPPRAIFILAAPRTGSTALYQAMARTLALPYISNFTNTHFAETPIIGLASQKSVPRDIGLESSFGKTKGAFQPSEGSAVLMNWFGGGHPSALVSHRSLGGKEPHIFATLRATEALYGQPLLIKNAWNCFRVRYLESALPEAKFVWLRRDVVASAASDLEARWVSKGTDQAWNSATPANYEALMCRPPVEQVVENQYEFNRAISEALPPRTSGRCAEVWYEDFVAAPEQTLAHVTTALRLNVAVVADLPPSLAQPQAKELTSDRKAIAAYVTEHAERLALCRYSGRSSYTDMPDLT